MIRQRFAFVSSSEGKESETHASRSRDQPKNQSLPPKITRKLLIFPLTDKSWLSCGTLPVGEMAEGFEVGEVVEGNEAVGAVHEEDRGDRRCRLR